MKHALYILICLLIILVTASFLRGAPESAEFVLANNDTSQTVEFVLANNDTSQTVKYEPVDDTEIFQGVFLQDLGGIVNIRARLNDPDVRFFVGHPSSPKVVCSQLNQFDLQVAVNGSGFYADTGAVDPFGMVDGEIYSIGNEPGITIAILENNEVLFLRDGERIPRNTVYAVSGFNRVVSEGNVVDRFYPGHQDYKVGYGTVRPRTLISTDGQYLTITLFESPSTVTAAGEYILKTFPGTTDVFNMDGGGSTNGCAQGIGPLVVETGRPVANVFGIYALPTR